VCRPPASVGGGAVVAAEIVGGEEFEPRCHTSGRGAVGRMAANPAAITITISGSVIQIHVNQQIERGGERSKMTIPRTNRSAGATPAI